MDTNRKKYVMSRIKSIIEKFPDEQSRRKAFARSCGSLQERQEVVKGDEFKEFKLDEKIVLNQR